MPWSCRRMDSTSVTAGGRKVASSGRPTVSDDPSEQMAATYLPQMAY